MSEDDQEIFEEFVQESREHLAAIEPDLLEMERQGSSTSSELVNRVFRAIHSTKGGAAFLSFESLKEFSHVMENVLMLIRDGKLLIEPDVIDALLRGVDVLRRMVDDVRASDSVDCTEERKLLEAVLKPEQKSQAAGGGVVPNKAGTKTTDGQAGTGQQREPMAAPRSQDAASGGREVLLHELLAHGHRIYRLAMRTATDLATLRMSPSEVEQCVSGIGRIIRRCPPRPAENPGDAADPIIEWEIASVLDRRLLVTATGLPDRCLTEVEREVLLAELGKAGIVVPHGASAKAPTTPVGDQRTVAPQVQAPSSRASDAKPSGAQAPTPPSAMSAASNPAQPPPVAPPRKSAGSAPLKDPGSEGNESLRVRIELLNRLMDSASELVLGRNQLLRALKEQSDKSAGLGIILQHIDRVTTDLQEGIMQTRMQEVGTLFGRFARVARDLGRQLGKNVELRAEGNHVELDKSIIEALVDPLTHIVRNAVDHALETPDERRKRKKPEVGRILLSASHESGQVKIVVEDDGRGIDRGKVLRKALEKGLITASAAEKASDRDVVNLLMRPGFSTADQISDVSGRGVGMDVVRNNVEALGGQIDIDSEFGVGTSVQLRLPLTLAIIPSLIVGAAGARFAVPQASIVELVWVRSDRAKERIQCLQGALMLRLRERLVPLVKVEDVLGGTRSGPEGPAEWENTDAKDHYILLLRSGAEHYGLVVDELFESEEIVVKPLPHFLKGIECFAGTTILGDGSVTMILDPSGVATRAGLRFASSGETDVGNTTNVRAVGTAKRSVILFAGSPDEQYIVPQEQVLRLERVDRVDLRRTGGKDYVCYRGAGLPLVRLEQVLPVGGVPDSADEVFLLIPRMAQGRAAEPTAGILVWRILDALDLELNLQAPLFSGPGVKGATLLDGILTTYIDPVVLVNAACPNKERAA